MVRSTPYLSKAAGLLEEDYGLCGCFISYALAGSVRQMTSASALPPEWQQPPQNFALSHHEVHVWAAPLDQPASAISELLRTLSPEESERARRFHALRDRARYIVAHGALRDILSRYMNLAPSDVRLCAAPSGKPALATAAPGQPLDFNLSHSYDLALVAIGSGRRLGVDVERIRAEASGEAIAERFFAPAEAAMLRMLPPEARLAAFFAGWTRKEAYSKAGGEGLRKPLDQFAVSIAPEQPAALLYDASDPSAPSRWSLRALDVGRTYAAAVAIEGHGWRPRRWLWSMPASPR